MVLLLENDVNLKVSRLRIIKNIVVISTSFLLVFSGLQGLVMLQSTMNNEDGIGTITISIVHSVFCISSLLCPKYVIQKIGCKSSIILSQICYCFLIAANFYPYWIIMIPSAILSGIAASTLWGGKCTYFNKASFIYCSLMEKEMEKAKSLKASVKSKLTLEPLSVQNSLKPTASSMSQMSDEVQATWNNANLRKSLEDSDFIHYENCDSNVNPAFKETPTECEIVESSEANVNNLHSNVDDVDILQNSANHEAINSRFFAFHSLVYRSAEIWSNLLSYYILKIDSDELVVDISCTCGANFCNVEQECMTGSIGGVSDERRYLLTGICVAVSSMAVILLLLCLDSIEKKKEPVKFSLDILMATMNQCKKKEQLYLVPITLLIGLVDGFYAADVTKAYIGCALGTQKVGLVTVASGISCALSAPVCGWFVKHIGRIPIIFLGIAVTIATNILLLLWTPNSSQLYVFYLIAAFRGVVNGTLWTHIPALYGVLFKEDEEAAFACFYTWSSLGRFVAWICSNFLCIYIKIYILLVIAFVALIGYLMAERSFALRKEAMRRLNSIVDTNISSKL